MIKFYDPSGASHFGQASITRTTSVNGGLSLTGEVFDGDDVLNGLDYGWWLSFDNEKYVITYKKLSDDTNIIVFDAVQQFFWDFAKVALHSQYTGSHEYAFYLNQLFNGSGYTYKNDVTVPAFEKENWGYKNKLSLFNDIMDQVDVEFEVHNETVHIAKQIGSDLTSFVRKGINLSDLTEEIKISDFATYAKGYGAFEDPQDPSKGRLEVEYRSELADKFGVLEMDPIVDERYTIANNLIAELKNKIDATYTVSMTMNIYDLESAGYPNYESPKVGDWILAIDEALNFKRKIRIIKLEEKFDVTGKRIGYTATCGDLSIVDQYTNLQGSLDSKVQRIQESIDSVATSANGKNSNYYGAKEPVNANEGDLWFDQSNSDPDKWTIKQWLNGRWEQITLNPGEISDKVNAAKAEAETAIEKAEQLATKYDDTNSLASQALDRATSAQSEAGSAIAKAESTASEFGKVSQKADSAFDNAMSAQNAASSAVATANSTASEFGNVSQKTDSAVANALNAQSAANDAVKQASSAAADSKDAKQIAGAVSQSYKTLTDGSTMTIAELESGLAVKLTKSDLDGYATETWTQNQVKMTADGINGTMSSIKGTVDSHTTSINDLKADSSSFKSQFTTVNNTLGKQTTDIGTLQASSKELTSGFNTLTTDNATNKNDISQLKQTSTEVSSTLETVKTQVQNSAVGTNLLYGTAEFNPWNGDLQFAPNGYLGLTLAFEKDSDGDIAWHLSGTANSSGTVGSYNWQLHGAYPSTYAFSVSVKGTFANTTLSGFYVEDSSNITISNNWSSTYSRWVVTGEVASGNGRAAILYFNIKSGDTVDIWVKKWKLEKGNLATDWCPNPADNATVTAFSQLSQTVDGMQSDISKKIEQSDLNGYATETWTQNKIKTTADGITGTLSSVKTTVDEHDTSINELKADSSSFKSQFTTVNNTLGKHTTDIGTLQASSKSLSASFDSLNSDNDTNKHNISQLQASATTFNSTLMTVQQRVTDSAVGTNLLKNTGDLSSTSSTTSWSTLFGSSQIYDSGITSLSGVSAMTFSFDVYVPLNVTVGSSIPIHLKGQNSQATNVGTDDYNTLFAYTGYAVKQTDLGKTIRVSYPLQKDPKYQSFDTALADTASITIRQSSDTPGFVYSRIKLEKGSVATDWCPNPADNATVTAVSSISQTVERIQTTVSGKVDNETYQSKINQLSDQINLRVESKGVINAVNVSKEGIQIYGDKLHITATTYIDDAIIKNAMIESINADKIQAGTIDASKIQVIHLNADNITTGSIHGSNLDINLNTGNVEFQEGRIHNSSNTIDININSGYMSVANGSNRVMLKNGEMQFVEPGTYDTSTNPYLKISNTFGGQSTEGAAFIGRKYAVLTNSDNATGNEMFDIGLGEEKFSGIATGYGTGYLNSGWHMTKVGGAERGVVISGGKATSYRQYWSASPSIMVGAKQTSTNSGGMHGPNIIMDCDYLYNYSTWRQTSSHAANVYVADDGAIVRASSASKYKTNIERSFETEMGERILEVPTAHWFDKAEVRNKTLNPQAPDPRRYFGMIADDLDDAGLTELVEYNEKGEVEGIMYDRVALTIIPIVRNYRDRIAKLESEIKQLKEG